MEHLDEISVTELHEGLNVTESTATRRFLAAIAYKNGVTRTELAEWHDTGRRTICSWLEQAVTNDKRTG
jgi:chromosome segregation and condensation protein ScpB